MSEKKPSPLGEPYSRERENACRALIDWLNREFMAVEFVSLSIDRGTKPIDITAVQVEPDDSYTVHIETRRSPPEDRNT